MAISCPKCGADFDATLFEFEHRVRCACGAEIQYPGNDLRSGHVAAEGTSQRPPSGPAAEPKIESDLHDLG